jgi:hypothetical protein
MLLVVTQLAPGPMREEIKNSKGKPEGKLRDPTNYYFD